MSQESEALNFEDGPANQLTEFFRSFSARCTYPHFSFSLSNHVTRPFDSKANRISEHGRGNR